MTERVNTPDRGQNERASYPPSPFRIFEDFFNEWALRNTHAAHSEAGWSPAANISEREDGTLLLQVEVPGVSEKDINLKAEGKVLVVRGERRIDEPDGCTYHMTERNYGGFRRSFTLPDSADLDRIEANYKNGVLTITVPQKPETRVRTIKLNG